jgi:hypothetical protein
MKSAAKPGRIEPGDIPNVVANVYSNAFASSAVNAASPLVMPEKTMLVRSPPASLMTIFLTNAAPSICTPPIALNVAVDLEQGFKLRKVACKQREQHIVNHAHHRLLCRIQPHRHALALYLNDFVVSQAQGVGKWLQRAPQHALAGTDKKTAGRHQRFFKAFQLLGLLEIPAQDLRLG